MSCTYNSVFYFTTKQMATKGTKGVHVDVPAVVEEPEIHLLSRTRSSDFEQAVYSQDRFEDVHTLGVSIGTPDGMVYTTL